MLKELLERWARLEPERCHATTAGMFDIRCRAQEVIAVVGNLTSARPLGGPWLLAAIVDAIETRQGSWELECHEVRYHEEFAPKYSAIAHWRVPHDRPMDFNQFANFWASRDGATPAEALLSAYLSALEAQS